jgi:amino acid permease
MPERTKDATWSLVFWLVPMVAAVGYGLWCISDGWFSLPGYEHKSFNQLMTPVAFAIALYCLWTGVKEYRKVQRQLQEGQAESRADQAAGPDDEKNNSSKPL